MRRPGDEASGYIVGEQRDVGGGVWQLGRRRRRAYLLPTSLPPPKGASVGCPPTARLAGRRRWSPAKQTGRSAIPRCRLTELILKLDVVMADMIGATLSRVTNGRPKRRRYAARWADVKSH